MVREPRTAPAVQLDISLCVPSLRGGGAEGAMVRLANELAGRGHTVEVVVMQAEGPWKAELTPAVRIVNLDRSRVIAALFPLRRYLKGRGGVFVANMTHLNVVSMTASLFLARRPLMFVVEHNDRQRQLDGISRPLRWLFTRLLSVMYRQAHAVLAVSRDLAADIDRILHFKPGSTQVLPNGLDLEAVEAQASQPVAPGDLAELPRPLLLAIGRLVEQKGFSLLLDAAAVVLQKQAATLVILGEGPLRSELALKARQLGIAHAVYFPGFLSNPFPLLKHADLFVLSSLYEGFGIVVLEAMACGTPVVASDCHWGPAELLGDGEAGRLVPTGDAAALAQGILEMLAAPEQAEKMARKAYDVSKNYRIERVADTFEILVRRLMAETE